MLSITKSPSTAKSALGTIYSPFTSIYPPLTPRSPPITPIYSSLTHRLPPITPIYSSLTHRLPLFTPIYPLCFSYFSPFSPFPLCPLWQPFYAIRTQFQKSKICRKRLFIRELQKLPKKKVQNYEPNTNPIRIPGKKPPFRDN